MITPFILQFKNEKANLEVVGGKGQSLTRLVKAGFPVPDGFHITTQAYKLFVEENHLTSGIKTALDSADPEHPASLQAASENIRDLFLDGVLPVSLEEQIREAYSELVNKKGQDSVAVRSSATAEDLPEASFAGQQDSFLNLKNEDEVLLAVKKCWASLWTARAISYRIRQNIGQGEIALAVVVQVLVNGNAAGILFTANPLNGNPDQMVISASWGLGEAIVSGQVNPDMYTLDKKSGKLLVSEISDKATQTIAEENGTKEVEVSDLLRKEAVLNETQIKTLGGLGNQIEDLYGSPMDIEWVLMDGKFFIVQARPITSLPVYEPEPPNEWKMPNPKGRYMRSSIVDLMPDPLSPLFASMALPKMNNAIMGIAKDMMGIPEDTFANIMLTINGYAYQSVSYSPRQWGAILFKIIPATIRLLKEGVPYWQDVARPRYHQICETWENKALDSLSNFELLNGAEEMLEAFAQHLSSLMTSTMGPSAGSEAIFSNIYSKLIRKEGDPESPAFLMGFENIPLKSEKALYDLSIWCRKQIDLAEYLKTSEAEVIQKDYQQKIKPEQLSEEIWMAWIDRFQNYLQNYGYLIYDMDFAKPLPMDEPMVMINSLKLYVSEKINSPYERQNDLVNKRRKALEAVGPRVKGLKGWAFSKSLKWAQKQAPLREDGISEIGRGYPVLRKMLITLGNRFSISGCLDTGEDIFWLEESEVRSLVRESETSKSASNYSGIVKERKALWKSQKKASPPPQLPSGKKYMGFEMDSLLSGGEGSLEGNQIKGVGASPGRVTAPARILHGQEDFERMRPGDILVAGITTPAWTPLFALAAGVITDVGGPLSHGSIVAREYGIPAVMGTGIATKTIRDGQIITLDGGSGTVFLLEKNN